MRFALLLAIASAFIPGLACAQIPTSTADVVTTPGKQPVTQLMKSDAALRDTVRCVVNRQPDRVRRLLELVPGTHEEELVITSFYSRLGSCLSGAVEGISFPRALFRGVVAEEVFSRDFPAGLPGATPSVETTGEWFRLARTKGALNTDAQLLESARCAVAKVPGDAEMLVKATPLAPDERAALSKLAPVIGDCLENGISVEFSRQMLRAMVAQALYAYALSARAGFPAGDKLAAGEPSR